MPPSSVSAGPFGAPRSSATVEKLPSGSMHRSCPGRTPAPGSFGSRPMSPTYARPSGGDDHVVEDARADRGEVSVHPQRAVRPRGDSTNRRSMPTTSSRPSGNHPRPDGSSSGTSHHGAASPCRPGARPPYARPDGRRYRCTTERIMPAWPLGEPRPVHRTVLHPPRRRSHSELLAVRCTRQRRLSTTTSRSNTTAHRHITDLAGSEKLGTVVT